MSRMELQFLEKIGDSWQEATPGFCVQAYHRGKKIVDIEVGETYPFYDWASLTKLAFSTTALMFLHDEKRYRVNDPVSRWVPWFPEESPVRLRDLLSHSAGLTWWYPFFKSVIKKAGAGVSPEESWEVFLTILKRKVLGDLKRQEAEKNSESRGSGRSSVLALKRSLSPAVYSDLDFFLLGQTIESLTGTTLYTAWTQVQERVGFRDTDFHRGNRPRYARKLYAPTEKCAWRGKLMQGEVHDENTWSLKGVAPHAGLFGPIDDLSRWGLFLRGAMRGEKSRRFASAETTRLFTKRSIPRVRGDWALGFMMPTKGGASCGPLFSLSSVGHTGFTGTSLWYDPKQDLLITILSNRVHPTRENKTFLKLRPQIHTWIAEGI